MFPCIMQDLNHLNRLLKLCAQAKIVGGGGERGAWTKFLFYFIFCFLFLFFGDEFVHCGDKVFGKNKKIWVFRV